MTTSRNDIEQTEKFLFGELEAGESFVFEAKMLTNPVLRLNVHLQKKVYSLIQLYHRKKLKEEAEAIHQKLFAHPEKADFKQTIIQLFNS